MNGVLTTILNGVISASNPQLRFTQTNANLSANGFLCDFKFTVPVGYTKKWDFLKDCFVNITKRIGSGNGGSVALLNNVRMYDFLSLSDFEAGVSMNSTSFDEGKEVRISGYLPCGYFQMSSRDALEITFNIGNTENLPSANVTFEFNAVFRKAQATQYICYQSTSPTGADQPYKNVLGLYYIGTSQNADSSITDQIGNKNVNIASSIAYANSIGRFEFFTDFGELYTDVFDLSQDLNFRVPVTAGASVLVKTMAFFPEETENSLMDINATRNALLEQIKNGDSEKYKYLMGLGLV